MAHWDPAVVRAAEQRSSWLRRSATAFWRVCSATLGLVTQPYELRGGNKVWVTPEFAILISDTDAVELVDDDSAGF
jgi:hypothetical protein